LSGKLLFFILILENSGHLPLFDNEVPENGNSASR